MNPDIFKNSLNDNTLNAFSYKSPFRNLEANYNLKKTLNNAQYGPIMKLLPSTREMTLKYNGSLPFDHGNYNNMPEVHKFYNLNRYIPPSYRDYEIGDKHGVLYRVIQERDKNV